MALQLGDYVAYGELWNTCRNSVCGWLGLMGLENQIHLELTGNCEADLAGKHIRFRARTIPSATFEPKPVRSFQIRHIGPVGKITAALQVQVDATGNIVPPDLWDSQATDEWKPLFHLEWFGQHGRTVVQMVDPVIQFVDRDNAGEEAADAFFGALFPDADDAPEDDAAPQDAWQDDPDPYCPSGDFEGFLAAGSDADEVADDIREMELMDDLLETDDGESPMALLGGSAPLPNPETLDENQAAYVLRFILARLATYGVAINMCEHVTALDTYRMFREHMAVDAQCFSQLKGTGWVQHYMTSEYCPLCEEEFEREWQERQESRQDGPADDSITPG